MIKYLGSKRRLVPVLDALCVASGATTALDLFTGTTRVAQAFKARGARVTAVDSARHAHLLAPSSVAPAPDPVPGAPPLSPPAPSPAIPPASGRLPPGCASTTRT